MLSIDCLASYTQPLYPDVPGHPRQVKKIYTPVGGLELKQLLKLSDESLLCDKKLKK